MQQVPSYSGLFQEAVRGTLPSYCTETIPYMMRSEKLWGVIRHMRQIAEDQRQLFDSTKAVSYG